MTKYSSFVPTGFNGNTGGNGGSGDAGWPQGESPSPAPKPDVAPQYRDLPSGWGVLNPRPPSAPLSQYNNFPTNYDPQKNADALNAIGQGVYKFGTGINQMLRGGNPAAPNTWWGEKGAWHDPEFNDVANNPGKAALNLAPMLGMGGASATLYPSALNAFGMQSKAAATLANLSGSDAAVAGITPPDYISKIGGLFKGKTPVSPTDAETRIFAKFSVGHGPQNIGDTFQDVGFQHWEVVGFTDDGKGIVVKKLGKTPVTPGNVPEPKTNVLKTIPQVNANKPLSLLPTSDKVLVDLQTKQSKLASSPVIKNIVGIFTKEKQIGDPVGTAKILQGRLADIVEQDTANAMSHLDYLIKSGAKDIKIKNNIVLDKRVIPLSNAPKLEDGKTSMFLHDIVEYADRYEMPDGLRKYVTEIRSLSNKTSTMLEEELSKHNIQLHKIAGEDDWTYLRRVVDKIGELDAFGAANWKGTQKPRILGLAGEGEKLTKKVTYLTPEQEIYYQITSAYRWLADLQVKDELIKLTTTAKSRVPLTVVEDLIEKNSRRIAIDKTMNLITRAARGEKLTYSSLSMIRNKFPEVAASVEDLIATNAKYGQYTKLKQSLNTLESTVKNEFWAAKTTYQQALQSAGPKIDEAVGWYLGPKRIITTQEIAGKQVLGRDLARQIEEQFGYRRPGTVEKVIEKAGVVGGVMREMKASLDLSVQGIQTVIGGLGLDFYNLVVSPLRLLRGIPAKPTATWEKGAFVGWQGAFDPKRAASWIDRPEIKAMVQEAADHGATILNPSEYAEGVELLSKIPVAGMLYKRSAAAFTLGRTATQTYLYMAERARVLRNVPAGEVDKVLTELAQWTNLATGTMSTRGAGISAEQRAAESVLLFAPKLTRSTFALIGDLTSGGLSGSMTRKAMTGLIAGATATITFAAMALNQKPRINPLPEKMGGDGSKWLTVDIGGVSIGFGSSTFALIRMLSSIVGKVNAGESEDLIKFSMDNPMIRFIRGKLGPPSALGVDFISGEDYIGNLTRDNLLSVAKTLGGWATPIWSDDMVTTWERGAVVPTILATGVASIFGARVLPQTDWDVVKENREKYSQAEFKKPYADLNKSQTEFLDRKHPDLVTADTKYKEKLMQSDPAAQVIAKVTDDAIEKRNTTINQIITQVKTNPGFSHEDFDKQLTYLKAYYSGERGALWQIKDSDPETSASIKKWLATNEKPEDKATDDYNDFISEQVAQSKGDPDWKSIMKDAERWIASHAPQYREYILSRKNAWFDTLPPEDAQFMRDRENQMTSGAWFDNYRGNTTSYFQNKKQTIVKPPREVVPQTPATNLQAGKKYSSFVPR